MNQSSAVPAALFAATWWVLIAFLLVPPDLNYSDLTFRLASGSLTGPVILGTAWVLGLTFTLRNLATLRHLITPFNRPFFLLMALAGASMLWSANPEATARRLFRLYAFLVLSTGFCLVGWHRLRFQNVLRPALTALVVGSLIFILARPELADPAPTEHTVSGFGWRGLASQKNALGSMTAIAIIFWVHAWLARERRTLTCGLALVLCAICLGGSRSSTSIMNAVFSSALLVFLLRPPSRQMRRVTPVLVGIATIAMMVYALAVLNLVPGSGLLLGPIAALSGKDMTFTGRTDIWLIVKEQIALHPFFGIGYGAYWTGAVPESPSYEMFRRLYFYPTEAHNGYLETINDLGYLGGGVLIAFLIGFLRGALRLFQLDRTQGALYLALFFQQLLGNLSEAQFLAIGSLPWLIMTLTTVALARSLQMQTAGDPVAPRTTIASPPRPAPASPRIAPAASRRRPFGGGRQAP